MLMIWVEYIPFGVGEDRFTIGEMVIANDLTGDYDHGNYTVRMRTKLPGAEQMPIPWEEEFRVEGHPRDNSAWELVKLILNSKEV